MEPNNLLTCLFWSFYHVSKSSSASWSLLRHADEAPEKNLTWTLTCTYFVSALPTSELITLTFALMQTLHLLSDCGSALLLWKCCGRILTRSWLMSARKRLCFLYRSSFKGSCQYCACTRLITTNTTSSQCCRSAQQNNSPYNGGDGRTISRLLNTSASLSDRQSFRKGGGEATYCFWTMSLYAPLFRALRIMSQMWELSPGHLGSPYTPEKHREEVCSLSSQVCDNDGSYSVFQSFKKRWGSFK